MENQLVKKENQALARITRQTLLTEFSVVKCNERFAGIRDVVDFFKPENRSHSIGRLAEDLGDDCMKAYLEMWMVNLNEYLNVVRPMNETQIQETAFMIMKEFPNLKITDIYFVFNQVKLGRMKIMDRLDGTMIMRWFEEHLIQKADTSAMMSEQEHLSRKQEELNSFGGPRSSGTDRQEKIMHKRAFAAYTNSIKNKKK